ncbi:MAG: hypothetical protein IPN48_10110 [Sphingomonadales bacterium]|nr:hypothetical protein [Sphingomonadales bacterium]
MSEKAEVTCGVEPPAGHILWLDVAPVVDALDLSVPIAETLGVGGVLAEHPVLFRNTSDPGCDAERRILRCVFSTWQVSGPGLLIFTSIGRSTLA